RHTRSKRDWSSDVCSSDLACMQRQPAQLKWDEAKLAFDAGFRKAPGDSRFLVELAGVAYKQKDFRAAKKHLHAALKLNPRDPYSSEFLATIYFLEDNLEAALKYWNPEDKPRLKSVAF